jgi:hypothetical protein
MQQDPLMKSIRAQNLRLLGEAHHKLEEVEPAQRTLDQAVALNREVQSAHPTNTLYRRRVVTSLRYRAIVHRTNHRDELARESIEEARVEAQRLRDRDANDVGGIQLFAVVNEVYAEVLSDLGRHEDAFRVGEEVREAYRIMVERAGNAPGQLRSLAMVLRTNGAIHYNGGDFEGACRAWRESVDILLGLQRRNVITDYDRTNGLPEMQGYLTRSCNPPRAGLGRISI